MFRLGRVSTTQLAEIARAAVGCEPTYDTVGATLTGALPVGFRHDREELVLPDGPGVFDRAAEGIRRWAAHRGAGLTVEPSDAPRVGATVAVAAPVGPLTAVAVCRIVAVVEEANCVGFAYGTLPGHPESGEEAFLVERGDGVVRFRVVAFSKPAETLARLGGPVTRAVQRATTRRYLRGLASFAAESAKES